MQWYVTRTHRFHLLFEEVRINMIRKFRTQRNRTLKKLYVIQFVWCVFSVHNVFEYLFLSFRFMCSAFMNHIHSRAFIKCTFCLHYNILGNS